MFIESAAPVAVCQYIGIVILERFLGHKQGILWNFFAAEGGLSSSILCSDCVPCEVSYGVVAEVGVEGDGVLVGVNVLVAVGVRVGVAVLEGVGV